MPVHIVRQGECFSSLAGRYRLSVKTLYNHPDNAALKKKRPNPNILAPGDEVVIPKPHQKWVASATGRDHFFILRRRTIKLRLSTLSASGTPYEGKRFVLVIGTMELKGTTALGGLIEVEVPAEEQSAQLRVWLDDDDPDPHIDRDLAIGHLDPIDLASGVQARLANLGYPCAVNGEIDEATLVALRMFRAASNLPAVDGPDSGDHGGADDGAGGKSDDGRDGNANDADADARNMGETSDLDNTDESDDFDQDNEAALSGDVEKQMDDSLRAKLQELYEGK